MVYFAKVQLSPKLTCMHEYLPSFYLVFLSLLFAHKHTMIIVCFTYEWQVWDYTGLGYTRYNARDVGKEYLGYALTKAAVIC